MRPLHPDLACSRQLSLLPVAGAPRVLPAGHVGREGRLWRPGRDVPLRGQCPRRPRRTLKSMDFDCILFQTRAEFPGRSVRDPLPAQRRLPRIYLEHDPPQRAPDRHAAPGRRPRRPAGPRHAVQRPDVGQRPHADAGDRARRLRARGRALHGRARRGDSWSSTTSGAAAAGSGPTSSSGSAGEVPLDLVGMDAESLGGLGEVAAPRAARVRGAVSLLLQPDPLHQPRPGRHRGDDDRHADRRAGDDRDGRRSSRTASPASSRYRRGQADRRDARAARRPRRGAIAGRAGPPPRPWSGSRSSGSRATGKTPSRRSPGGRHEHGPRLVPRIGAAS